MIGSIAVMWMLVVGTRKQLCLVSVFMAHSHVQYSKVIPSSTRGKHQYSVLSHIRFGACELESGLS